MKEARAGLVGEALAVIKQNRDFAYKQNVFSDNWEVSPAITEAISRNSTEPALQELNRAMHPPLPDMPPMEPPRVRVSEPSLWDKAKSTFMSSGARR